MPNQTSLCSGPDAGCPECGSMMVGVEYAYPHPDQYDGVSEWRCMNEKCAARFGRWTGRRLRRGEFEPPYGGKP